jgi:hypothetical protein
MKPLTEMMIGQAAPIKWNGKVAFCWKPFQSVSPIHGGLEIVFVALDPINTKYQTYI